MQIEFKCLVRSQNECDTVLAALTALAQREQIPQINIYIERESISQPITGYEKVKKLVSDYNANPICSPQLWIQYENLNPDELNLFFLLLGNTTQDNPSATASPVIQDNSITPASAETKHEAPGVVFKPTIPTDTKICSNPGCQIEFTGRHQSLFCSDKCYMEVWHQKHPYRKKNKHIEAKAENQAPASHQPTLESTASIPQPGQAPIQSSDSPKSKAERDLRLKSKLNQIKKDIPIQRERPVLHRDILS